MTEHVRVVLYTTTKHETRHKREYVLYLQARTLFRGTEIRPRGTKRPSSSVRTQKVLTRAVLALWLAAAGTVTSNWHHDIVTRYANISFTTVLPYQAKVGHATARLHAFMGRSGHTVTPRQLSNNGRVDATKYIKVEEAFRIEH